MSEKLSDEATTVAKLLDVSLPMYPTSDERAAMRSGMGDATALCDMLERIILEENRGRRGKGITTKHGRELAAVAKRCADSIHQMREQVMVPPLPRHPTGAETLASDLYVSDRVYDGVRPVGPELLAILRDTASRSRS